MMTAQLNRIDPLAEEIARRQAPMLWDSEAIAKFVEGLIQAEGLTIEEAQARLELKRTAKVAEVEDLLTLVLETAEDEGATTSTAGWSRLSAGPAGHTTHARDISEPSATRH